MPFSRAGGIYTSPFGTNNSIATNDLITNYNNTFGRPITPNMASSPSTSTVDDAEGLSEDLLSLINSTFDKFLNNVSLFQESKDYNALEAEKSYNRQRELMKYQAELEKELRGTSFQDTVDDLRKAGINPSVYFSAGGRSSAYGGITSGSVNAASVGNPNADTISSLVNSYSNVLAAVASNKNADSAIIRSIISAIGSVFSFGIHASSSQSISDITRRNA